MWYFECFVSIRNRAQKLFSDAVIVGWFTTQSCGKGLVYVRIWFSLSVFGAGLLLFWDFMNFLVLLLLLGCSCCIHQLLLFLLLLSFLSVSHVLEPDLDRPAQSNHLSKTNQKFSLKNLKSFNIYFRRKPVTQSGFSSQLSVDERIWRWTENLVDFQADTDGNVRYLCADADYN